MKSYVLHGENQPESRRHLFSLINKAKKEGWEIIRFDWNNIDETVLLTSSRAQSMFSFGHLIVIENFFGKNKKSFEIIEELPQDEQVSYIFWEGKPLAPAVVKKLQKHFVVEEFKISVAVFNFLNSLTPGNAKSSLKLFRQALERDSAEFLLLILARHIRLLIWSKIDPQTLKLPDWQKRNLAKQGEKFTEKELIDLHTKLLELDRKNKRSQLIENLASNLDLMLLGL